MNKTLADRLRARAREIADQKEAEEANQKARRQATWDKAVARATSPDTQQLMLRKIEMSGLETFEEVVLGTWEIPNIKGGSAHDIPFRMSGNLFCAVRDKEVTEATILEWYPPFQQIKSFYEKEGLKVQFRANYNDSGDDWIDLVVTL